MRSCKTGFKTFRRSCRPIETREATYPSGIRVTSATTLVTMLLYCEVGTVDSCVDLILEWTGGMGSGSESQPGKGSDKGWGLERM
jgi:hypothetical protein